MYAFPFSKDTDGYLVDDPDFAPTTVTDDFSDSATVTVDGDLIILAAEVDPLIFSPTAARRLAKALKRAARFIEASK